jgi:predicted dienelactone hydrolase
MVGDTPPPRTSRRPQAAYGAILVLVAVPAALLPLLVLPRVPPIVGTGPYLVGVRDLSLTASTGSRPIPVRLWFPGEPEADLRPLPESDSLGSFEVALARELIGQPWGHAVRGVTRATVHASTPMRLLSSRREFPVVVLARPKGNLLLMRRLAVALASHGFVVVDPGARDPSIATLPWAMHDPTGAEHDSALQEAQALIEALRAIADVESGDPLAGRLLVDRVGWVGVGPSVAAGRSLAAAGPVAALVSIGAEAAGLSSLDAPPELRLEQVGAPTTAGGEMIRTAMPGSLPLDFTDLARWSPLLLRQAGRGGFIPAARMESWMQGWAATFFGVHLTGLPADSLRALSSRFPGTTVSLP